jgi:hypothetical protein
MNEMANSAPHDDWRRLLPREAFVELVTLQTVGDCLAPEIRDGSFCVFNTALEVRPGDVALFVLAEPAFGRRFAVKRYELVDGAPHVACNQGAFRITDERPVARLVRVFGDGPIDRATSAMMAESNRVAERVMVYTSQHPEFRAVVSRITREARAEGLAGDRLQAELVRRFREALPLEPMRPADR